MSAAEFPPAEAWAEFIAMRKKIKKPMTDYAQRLMLKRLAALVADDQDAEAVLNQSIRMCWQDVYAVKEEQQPAQRGATRQPYQTANEKAKEWADRLTGKGARNVTPDFIDLN